MTDHELEMLGRIDERTENIQKDITGIKQAVSDQYTKIDNMRSELDTLLQAHKDRTSSTTDNGCTVINTSLPGSNPILPRWAIGVIGGSGAVGIALLIVLLIILHKYGYL